MIGQNVCLNDNVSEIISYFHQNAPSYLEFCVYINTNIMLNMFFFFFLKICIQVIFIFHIYYHADCEYVDM